MVGKRSREAIRRKRARQYERLLPQIDALYDDLHQQYPWTFFRDPEQMHPLKVGIAHDLRARIEVPSRMLGYVMKRYTNRPAYLQALIAQKPRLDLSGQAVGTVTDDERANAQMRLRQLSKRRRPKASRGRQADEKAIQSQALHTPLDAASTAEISQSLLVQNKITPQHSAVTHPLQRLPANWQRILTHLSAVEGPQRPAAIGAALGMKNPGGILRRMRERGLVRQMKRGLYEIAKEPCPRALVEANGASPVQTSSTGSKTAPKPTSSPKPSKPAG